MMKRIKYFLIMAIAITVAVSCSNDDNDNDLNPIVGSWEMTQSEQGLEFSLTATFNANLTGTISTVITFNGETETENESFTWSTDGNKLTLMADGETDISTYSISGNKLTITSDGESIVLTRL